MENPSGVSANLSESTKSIREYEFKPEYIPLIYKAYGEGFTLTALLDYIKGSGVVRPIGNDGLVHSIEETLFYRTMKIKTLSSVAADTVTFILDDDDVDANGNMYPRVNFTTTVGSAKNGFTKAIITAINTSTHAVTIKRVDTTKPAFTTHQSNGDLAVGLELPVTDSAFAPETGQPSSVVSGSIRRSFPSQILKETLNIGGLEGARSRWEFVGDNRINEDAMRAELRLMMQQEDVLLMGQQQNNSITQANKWSENISVSMGRGIWDWIDSLGGEVATGSTGMAMDDLDTVAEYLESQGISAGAVLIVGGGQFMRNAENNFLDTTYGTNGTMPASMLAPMGAKFVDGYQDLAMHIGFKAIKKSGIVFYFMNLPAFSNPKRFGVSQFKLNNSGIVLPMESVVISDPYSNDKVTIPNLVMDYVGMGGYSRQRVVATLAGMSGYMQKFGYPVVDQYDADSMYWMSHIVPRFHQAYKAMLLKGE